MVMPEVKALHPEWDSVPYQVKRTAVRDACRAMSNVKTFNLELKASQTHDQGDFATQSRTAEAQALSKIRQTKQGDDDAHFRHPQQ